MSAAVAADIFFANRRKIIFQLELRVNMIFSKFAASKQLKHQNYGKTFYKRDLRSAQG